MSVLTPCIPCPPLLTLLRTSFKTNPRSREGGMARRVRDITTAIARKSLNLDTFAQSPLGRIPMGLTSADGLTGDATMLCLLCFSLRSWVFCSKWRDPHLPRAHLPKELWHDDGREVANPAFIQRQQHQTRDMTITDATDSVWVIVSRTALRDSILRRWRCDQNGEGFEDPAILPLLRLLDTAYAATDDLDCMRGSGKGSFYDSNMKEAYRTAVMKFLNSRFWVTGGCHSLG